MFFGLKCCTALPGYGRPRMCPLIVLAGRDCGAESHFYVTPCSCRNALAFSALAGVNTNSLEGGPSNHFCKLARPLPSRPYTWLPPAVTGG